MRLTHQIIHMLCEAEIKRRSTQRRMHALLQSQGRSTPLLRAAGVQTIQIVDRLGDALDELD